MSRLMDIELESLINFAIPEVLTIITDGFIIRHQIVEHGTIFLGLNVIGRELDSLCNLCDLREKTLTVKFQAECSANIAVTPVTFLMSSTTVYLQSIIHKSKICHQNQMRFETQYHY